MKNAQSINRKIAKTLLCSVLAAVFCSQIVQADENLLLKNIKTLKVIEFSKALKISSIEMSKETYLVQAKDAHKYGFGVAADNKNFSWGINNRGLSFLKTF